MLALVLYFIGAALIATGVGIAIATLAIAFVEWISQASKTSDVSKNDLFEKRCSEALMQQGLQERRFCVFAFLDVPRRVVRGQGIKNANKTNIMLDI